MLQTLKKNWWLLALCSGLYALISIQFFSVMGYSGPLTVRFRGDAIAWLGRFILAAAACSAGAGLWRAGHGKGWLLVLNGLALAALGVIDLYFIRTRVSFRTIALLIVVMAASTSALEVLLAQALRIRRRLMDGWLLTLAGALTGGFAMLFLALAFRWIRILPGSQTDLLWIGCYFACSSLCILTLAFRLHAR